MFCELIRKPAPLGVGGCHFLAKFYKYGLIFNIKMVNLEAIIWWLFLLDSAGANIAAWLFAGWYKKKYKKLSKHLPITKLWCLIYLVLVLWVGCALYRLGILPY